MIAIGVDISKDFFNVCAVDEGLNILHKESLPMNQEGFFSFSKIVSSFSNPVIALESSGKYHIPLLCFLSSLRVKVCLVNPKAIKNFSKVIFPSTPSKTDRKDAFIIACFIIKHPDLAAKHAIAEEIKVLARQIESISCEISQVKTKIKDLIFVLFPEAERHFNIFSLWFLKIIRKYPSSKAIAKASANSINKIIRKSSRGRKPTAGPLDIIELAKNSIGIRNKGFEVSLVFYIDKLLFLDSQLGLLKKTFEDLIKERFFRQIEILCSIRGISKILAGRLMAEIGSIKLFPSSRHFISYAGYDPVIKESGRWRQRMSISKQGNPHLRNVLFQMAVMAIVHNPVFRVYFEKKRKGFGSYKKSVVAVINKLIRVIYAMLTREEKFDPSKVAPSCYIKVKSSMEVNFDHAA